MCGFTGPHSRAGGHGVQAHELADAELAEACPFRWAERFDEVPGVFPADELGIVAW